MKQREILPLVIVEGMGPVLPGRNWLNATHLDWQQTHMISPDQWQNALSASLDQYSEVFQPGLGSMKGIQAAIHLTPGATPKFLK